MEKIEPYETEVGHSDRSKTPIEPMLSEQWFVKMGDLAELAMEAVRDGRVQFFPQRYAQTYLDWLGEKRDWCISRQLWWGHRIPVWISESGVQFVDPSASRELADAIQAGRVFCRGVEDNREIRDSPKCLARNVPTSSFWVIAWNGPVNMIKAALLPACGVSGGIQSACRAFGDEARRRRPRHLVQLRVVAVQHAGLAARQRGQGAEGQGVK